jgi:hypothetical protein
VIDFSAELNMTVKDILKLNLDLNRGVLNDYIKDMTDADLFVRPVPGANHIAWALGHLIASESEMLGGAGYPTPELPAGFAESHTKETSKSDDPKKFATKQQYLDLLDKTRKATLAALERASDADFDKPAPEPMQGYCKTIGALFHLLGAHDMMHAGQFAVLRRKLGKPILM